ncbi:small GTPase LIP1-like isoform X2 [Phoenix dactylifera]|uniref:Small GTPase LIP1-like isoform X2 n=1 Tax=Phoenix dactylifera TaxID=42345 RepID=A0A8B7BWB2_PHODC|nr:small GTPase LIP1-like isoform X2 [Phoenix dactylifera]
MFWRERERDSREQNGGPPCGQVRVLVVGDAGVGKTSLVHLIVKCSSIARPPQTIGCTVSMKHITYGSAGSSSNSVKSDAERDFFVELWDVSGHERYKDCRSLFYTQINGVIFVHDLSQRRTKTSLQRWATEIATTGTFSAPLGSGGPGGLPVPYLVISNKADIAAKEGIRGSSGNLVDVARQWVEKQGLLPSSEELPLTESFPGSSGLITAAKEARYDKEALIKFFRMLIRRRYFSDELPAPNPWSVAPMQNSIQRLDEISSDDDQFPKKLSLSGESYKYNALPPVPTQRNLTPPPTLYPQQPMSTSENYSFQRFSASSLPDMASTRSSRADINV